MIQDNIYAVIGAEVYFRYGGWIGQGKVIGIYKTLYDIKVEIKRDGDPVKYTVDARVVFDTLEQAAYKVNIDKMEST